MAFRQTYEQRPNSIGRSDQVAVLEDGIGGRVEVWPGQGFNAFRWRTATGAELLYATDTFFKGDRPSRSGIPVLFPFPNRIRAGKYTWGHKSYELSANDPSGQNAIHGFAFNTPWRVIDAGSDDSCAWVTGEWQLSKDARASAKYWPTDTRIRITYRLKIDSLAIKAVVSNRGASQLPFGLGYHPYFSLAPFGGESAVVMALAEEYWELEDSLPTGKRLAVDEARDLREGKPVAGMQLDDVLTTVRPRQSERRRGLVAAVRHPSGRPSLEVWASSDFQDLVVFTPPHRQAVCLEPYTCTTDAINLQPRDEAAGLRVLSEGEHWNGDIVLNFLHGPVNDQPATVAMVVEPR